MGGYGAFKLALTYPERYAAAASLSGVVDIADASIHEKARKDDWMAEFRAIFGDIDKMPGSKHDLFALAKNVAKASIKPRLYQCCGTEDILYEGNVRFRDAARKLSLDFTYEEGRGEHVWPYWDQMIQNVLKWMFPKGKKFDGLVGI